MNRLICYSIFVAVIINLVLPKLVMPFATKEEVKPPNGADKLSFKGQLMSMLVHHGQVPLTSSIIVALIVFLSIMLGKKLEKTIN